jgi:hypothetical protein
MNYKLQTMNYKLQTMNYQLQTKELIHHQNIHASL